MKCVAAIIAVAIATCSFAHAECEIPIYVQACASELNGCHAPVWQEYADNQKGLPCSTTIAEAQNQVDSVLRKAISNPVKKPSQVTLGACNLASPDNHFSKSAQRGVSCSPLQKVNHQILQHAAGLSTSLKEDAGYMEVLVGAVRFVLDGLIETSALEVATLTSVRQSVKTLTHMARPLVFQYVPAPDWSKRSHEPSRLAVPLLNDTTYPGGLEGWGPAHTAE